MVIFWEAQIFNSIEEMYAKVETIIDEVDIKKVFDPITGRFLLAWGGPLLRSGEP